MFEFEMFGFPNGSEGIGGTDDVSECEGRHEVYGCKTIVPQWFDSAFVKQARNLVS
jgi:hypothetical protein